MDLASLAVSGTSVYANGLIELNGWHEYCQRLSLKKKKEAGKKREPIITISVLCLFNATLCNTVNFFLSTKS